MINKQAFLEGFIERLEKQALTPPVRSTMAIDGGSSPSPAPATPAAPSAPATPAAHKPAPTLHPSIKFDTNMFNNPEYGQEYKNNLASSGVKWGQPPDRGSMATVDRSTIPAKAPGQGPGYSGVLPNNVSLDRPNTTPKDQWSIKVPNQMMRDYPGLADFNPGQQKNIPAAPGHQPQTFVPGNKYPNLFPDKTPHPGGTTNDPTAQGVNLNDTQGGGWRQMGGGQKPRLGGMTVPFGNQRVQVGGQYAKSNPGVNNPNFQQPQGPGSTEVRPKALPGAAYSLYNKGTGSFENIQAPQSSPNLFKDRLAADGNPNLINNPNGNMSTQPNWEAAFGLQKPRRSSTFGAM